MRTIIAGGRNYRWSRSDFRLLDFFWQSIPITEVVCGMARGADLLGKTWAEHRGIPVREFPAKWDEQGKAAGHIRNERMADYAQALIAFPGGEGTRSMISKAVKRGLKVEIVNEP